MIVDLNEFECNSQGKFHIWLTLMLHDFIMALVVRTDIDNEINSMGVDTFDYSLLALFPECEWSYFYNAMKPLIGSVLIVDFRSDCQLEGCFKMVIEDFIE